MLLRNYQKFAEQIYATKILCTFSMKHDGGDELKQNNSTLDDFYHPLISLGNK